MVFVHADLKERKEVLSFSTVSRYMVMRGESSPTIIPDEQMARFRFMLDYSEEAICMNSAPLSRGEKVRVVKGPLTGLVGELVTVDGRSKIAVRLNILGCACVDMPRGYVELIE
jgi:transcriptional antiterminator NusG